MPFFIKQRIKLRLVGGRPCNGGSLISREEISLEGVFENPQTATAWEKSEEKFALSSCVSPEGSGGVNPGDARAVYYLASAFKPSSALEIGTHVGTSTIHIASALAAPALAENNANARLVTVDVRDVNDARAKPWLKYGVKHSPAEMLNKAGLGGFVEFVRSGSVEFLTDCKQKFDFIFLDGSHSAPVVYKEIALALGILNKNGLILLHDYFPGLNPLWEGMNTTPGPFLAVQRLINEGAGIKALPFNNLPWQTKPHSRTTSLALLVKEERET